MEKNFNKFIEAYQKIKSDKIDICIVTMVNARGSIPQDIGTRMIVSINDILFGTVGGGKLEAKAISIAREILCDGKNKTSLMTWNLQKDVGMTCGGEVTLFFEPQIDKSRWEIVIFGAGHVSQELVRTLIRLDCHVKVIDQRIEWLEKLPSNVEKIHSLNPEDEVKNLSESSFVIIMTMGHSTDLPILAQILKSRKFPYLGVIGSVAKRNTLLNGLEQLGVEKENRSNFLCPIGEPIGSNSPSEIAISICAQLLKHRDLD